MRGREEDIPLEEIVIITASGRSGGRRERTKLILIVKKKISKKIRINIVSINFDSIDVDDDSFLAVDADLGNGELLDLSREDATITIVASDLIVAREMTGSVSGPGRVVVALGSPAVSRLRIARVFPLRTKGNSVSS